MKLFRFNGNTPKRKEFGDYIVHVLPNFDDYLYSNLPDYVQFPFDEPRKKFQLKNVFKKHDLMLDLSIFMIPNRNDYLITNIQQGKEKNYYAVLDMGLFLAAREKSSNFGRFDAVNHTMEFGCFPASHVGNINKKHLRPTGRTYSRNTAVEYRDKTTGARYAKYRTPAWSKEPNVKKNADAWYRVEPLKWQVTNWEDLPTSINPQGNGKSDYIYLKIADQGREIFTELDSVLEDKKLFIEQKLIHEVLNVPAELLKLNHVEHAETVTKFLNDVKDQELEMLL